VRSIIWFLLWFSQPAMQGRATEKTPATFGASGGLARPPPCGSRPLTPCSPVTLITEPVMNEEASEARSRAAAGHLLGEAYR